MIGDTELRKRKGRAKILGRLAYIDGKSTNDNPYDPVIESEQFKSWLEGYNDEQDLQDG